MQSYRHNAPSRPVGAFAAYRIERVHARLTAQGGAVLAKHSELTLRQWWIIADMAEMSPRTATDLAELSDIDKGLLSRNLKVLVEHGLVTFEKNEADLRQHLIALTDAGRKIYEEVLPIMDRRNAHLIKGVSEADYKTFLDVLDRIESASQRTDFQIDYKD
jgi:DNA-binding MarR family transcriptional regulator